MSNLKINIAKESPPTQETKGFLGQIIDLLKQLLQSLKNPTKDDEKAIGSNQSN